MLLIAGQLSVVSVVGSVACNLYVVKLCGLMNSWRKLCKNSGRFYVEDGKKTGRLPTKPGELATMPLPVGIPGYFKK